MKRYFDWKNMSPMRKRYVLRLAGRIVVFVLGILLLILKPSAFEVLQGWNFFNRFSVLHLLWGIWLVDMAVQILPVGKDIPLGSQKLFRNRFIPIREKFSKDLLMKYIRNTSNSAGRVMILWVLLIAAIGGLYAGGILTRSMLFLVCVLFYVCDLICVLIWCPFRLLLKTRCCTTCRIFNWDHFMMFSPLIFIPGFYTWSLLLISIVVVIVWEVNLLMHPERFWDHSNAALLCSNCTDKLCTQYCQKLR